ncbi:MAG TPA: Hsp20/alpha crystallin family protein [Candidatus Eisenbacteria bacterium]|nr:Hsp20/alpha crystallin family protein [Candidatus Eisenbacteria bacterium]
MPANDPHDPYEKLQREIVHLVRGLVYHRHPATHFSETLWAPAADLVVGRHGARVLLELAGVGREHVRVTLKGRVIEVNGRRHPPQEPPHAHYHRAEIYFGPFQRVIELPWEADPEHVTAMFRDGLLELRLKPLARAHVEVAIEGHRVATSRVEEPEG